MNHHQFKDDPFVVMALVRVFGSTPANRTFTTPKLYHS